jgi:organic hydroperoxide reductase OsmC/OhrA
MPSRPAEPILGVAKEALMGMAKVHRYEVHTRTTDDRRVALESSGKGTLRVATPPDFRGGVRGTWSPEELLVGSLATCFQLTLVAIAQRAEVPLREVEVNATGHVEGKAGRYQFIAIELDVHAITDPEREADVREVADLARERCIVESALKTPVTLNLEVDGRTKELVSAERHWAW